MSPDSLNPTVGSTVKFECIVEGLERREYLSQNENLRFNWYKNNAPLEDSSIIRHGEIILRNLVESDSGAYTCQVVDRLTNKISNTGFGSLTVKRPPEESIKVRVSPNQIEITEGESLTLDCFVKGGRNSVVEWIKVDDILDEKRHLKVNNKLVINDIKVEDSGKYECIADNENFQHAMDSATVIVNPVKKQGKYFRSSINRSIVQSVF